MNALGIALVSATLFVLFGFLHGLRETVLLAADEANSIVLSRNATSEPGSETTREQYNLVRARPELAADSAGEPLISPEIVTAFNPDPDEPYAASQFSYLRGVDSVAYKVHRSMRLRSGRFPTQGKSEAIVGAKLAAKFPNLRLHTKFRFGRRLWTVVGVFTDNGSARESEIWSDLDVLQQELDEPERFNSLHVVLKRDGEESLARALANDGRLGLDLMSEKQFYTEQTDLVDQLRRLGLVIAAIVAVGAGFGSMNTMYAAVARRTAEIGVLAALGFSRSNILLSFLTESLALALAGGIAGDLLGLAIAGFAGLNSREMNVGAFIFSFQISGLAFAAGLIGALAIGAFGGILPAWRASRIPLLDALRPYAT